jgi:adenylate kinase
MCPINDPFFGSGSEARVKILFLGSSYSHLENLMNRVRSLNIEHVSPSRLVRPEISRRPVSAVAEEANTLALMRRWFFARKPDAGFILSEFPATLLQAKVFDEWLDARDENLQGVFVGLSSNESVVLHYRTLGLLTEASVLAA